MLFLRVTFKTSMRDKESVYSHWDVDKFDKVTNEPHDSKTNCDRSANLDEL